MAGEEIELVEPTEDLRDAYMEYVAEFEAAGEDKVPGSGAATGQNFAEFVGRLRDHARGIGLPEGYVPASTYWLVGGGRILGTCDLRHRLTDALRDFGGHVGYSVRPSQRGKGYGTRQLALVLAEAGRLGIRRVLITCDKNNIASVRVIQKNGGVLASESFSEQGGRITRRYWIDL